MQEFQLHHVSVPTRDLDRAATFYETVLGLKRIARPPFPVAGIWYGIGRNHIHVTVHPDGNFRDGRSVESNDIHFALCVADFEAAYGHLTTCGYGETLPDDHPHRILVKRAGAAGFPQMFVMDPDRHLIEINGAPFLAE